METPSKEWLEKLARFVSEELEITTPTLYIADESYTTTKMAWIKMPDQKLFIKPNLPFNEATLAIAYELRHLYQLKNMLYADEIGNPTILIAAKT